MNKITYSDKNEDTSSPENNNSILFLCNCTELIYSQGHVKIKISFNRIKHQSFCQRPLLHGQLCHTCNTCVVFKLLLM